MSLTQPDTASQPPIQTGLTYESAGVANTGDVLGGLIPWVNRTLAFRRGRTGDSLLPIGFYANVLDMGHGVRLAISTDGVGTKILIAEMLGRWDTIGIDCVAMNVNDLICVGAEPVAMLDYIAVSQADPQVLEAIGRGLYAGAEQANISIPGGELAQLGGMIGGLEPGSGVDLVGTCVGLVQREGRVLIGEDTQDGDRIIGLASTGVHSNGYTLARRALFDRGGLRLDSQLPGLSRPLGEELLTPTQIYVKPALEMLEQLPGLRALAHITSDGFLNLMRIPGSFHYRIVQLPDPPAIFRHIQQHGQVTDAEMYRVYNMGIGLCAVVASQDVDAAIAISRRHGIEAWEIGRVESGSAGVTLEPVKLHGAADQFQEI